MKGINQPIRLMNENKLAEEIKPLPGISWRQTRRVTNSIHERERESGYDTDGESDWTERTTDGTQ